MRNRSSLLEYPAAIALACLAGAVAHAQQVDVEAPGTTVRVGPDRGADRAVEVRVESGAEQAAASYWLGILGGDVSPELRAHLGLAEQGVIVREVVPKSPAEEGGMKQHDILLQANGTPVASMSELVKLVGEVGPMKGQITFELIRAGQPQTVWVSPTERPAQQLAERRVGQPGFREDPNAAGVLGGVFGDRFGGRFGGDGFGFRAFGPGVVLNAPNVQVQANGMSVSVSTVNGKTRVKVKRGNEEWDVDATDPAALEELPEDIQAVVKGVMPGANVDINIDEMIPDLDGLFGGRFRGGIGGRRDMNRQLEELRQQVEELRRALGQDVAPANPPAAGGEAPAFRPDQVDAPVEVEIPVEVDPAE